MKMLKIFLFINLVYLFCSCKGTELLAPSSKAVAVPIAGNTYVTAGEKNSAVVTLMGVETWKGEDAVLSTWFKVTHGGDLDLYLKAGIQDGPATLKVTVGNKDFLVEVKEVREQVLPVGEVKIDQPGYVRVDIQGVKKEGEQYPLPTEIIIDGDSMLVSGMHFVHDFEPYWGLRGPSVHMKYTLPAEPVEYFYNEITVPKGEDVVGSYFMSNGFGQGYCGMQVNSDDERRILFSVWSSYETDDPSTIPEDYAIKLLAQGKDVQIGEFGNEGSGGQSFLRYSWKAGETYRFLTQIRPNAQGNTEYYAWFYDPEIKDWHLIAGFLRQKTDTWYTNAHSFLENFIPEQGYLSRKVLFGNEWARTARGQWIELTEGRFTFDATAKAQVRMDYAGGLEGDRFFLKNGGFFNESTEMNTIFNRSARGKRPSVDVFRLVRR